MTARRLVKHSNGNGRELMMGAVLLALTGVAALAWMAGCAPNDPFDPESLANKPPTIAFYVSPQDTSGNVEPISYSERSFHWSGTDPDGWVVEYYVSIDTSDVLEAPWDTTTSTDTTMTFVPDDEGSADATFKVACRDNRGAYSDTVIQFIPVRNFPPVVELLSDFDPLSNMQREFRDADGNVIEDGSAAADTVFWNWGAMNFRLLAYDIDGLETLDPFFLYTLAEGDPEEIYDRVDPRADPETTWVRVPFLPGNEESVRIELFMESVVPGTPRTLSISVSDRVGSTTVFQYSWEVRTPRGSVLYIPDSSASRTRNFYRDYLDGRFGEGQWDMYTFWKGWPDVDFVLLESMRKFGLVLWTDSGAASNNIREASALNGVLPQYLDSPVDLGPKKILMISRILTGSGSGLSNPFRENILGININALPEAALIMPAGPQALGLQPYLPDMTSTRGSSNGGVGLELKLDNSGMLTSEFLYQMEECGECYGDPRRPAIPPDPHVGVRNPLRSVDPLADIVGISLQLDDFEPTEVYQALDAILEFELGVSGK